MNQYPIYCINLEHRKDRKEHSLNQFSNLGISDNTVKYLHFIKDPRGGAYGCFDSHIKIWNDFFVNHPNEKYALVFEDDFEATHNTKSIIKDAVNFLDNNYDKIDMVFLHNMRVDVENMINNDQFTCGYGLCTHAMFVTRHYIKSIIDNHGKLPEPNGRHIDFEICFNIINKDNKVYSDKCFFTKDICFKQLVDKSDNYLNFIDELFRIDNNMSMEIGFKVLYMLKNTLLLNDDQVKIFECVYSYITTVKMNKTQNSQNFTTIELLKIAQMFLKK